MTFSDDLNRMIDNSGASQVGLAAHQLGSGNEILINPDTSFHPASTMKICVMMEVFHQARQGAFSLDDLIPVKNEFASLVDQAPYSLSDEDDSEIDLYHRIGQSLSIRDLVQRMITVSSNLATNILMDRVTPEKTTRFMRELGAESLVVRRGVEDTLAYRMGLNNASTARGFLEILIKLANRAVISQADSDEMIEVLAQQKINEMIPSQLPADVRIAHKTGWTGEYHHDLGIVFPSNSHPFVLVIMTKGFKEEEKAPPFIGSLAKSIYDHWTNELNKQPPLRS
jgi:beta-lactamase class A